VHLDDVLSLLLWARHSATMRIVVGKRLHGTRLALGSFRHHNGHILHSINSSVDTIAAGVLRQIDAKLGLTPNWATGPPFREGGVSG